MKSFVVAALALSLLTPISAEAASVKAGAKCTKADATAIASGKKFTCVKKGGKLIWNSGVAILRPGVCPAVSATDK